MKKLKPLFLTGNDYDIDDIDRTVRSRWHLKDPALKIVGLDKTLIEEKEGFKIYEVDGEWIRNNLDVGFGTGGHGLVHSYIPMDEVWVWPVAEDGHSIALHEIIEHNLMKKKNLEFREAHKETMKLTEDLSIKEKKEAKIKGLIRAFGTNEN